MFAFFMAMAPDPDGAADLREAMEGHQAKEIALACHVPPSLVTKWLVSGNVPDCHKKNLPPDVRLRLEELRAKRAGALVIPRDLVLAATEAVTTFLTAIGCRLVMTSASLAPADCGALTRRQERHVA